MDDSFTNIDNHNEIDDNDDDEIEIGRNEPLDHQLVYYSDYGDYKFYFNHPDVSINLSPTLTTPLNGQNQMIDDDDHDVRLQQKFQSIRQQQQQRKQQPLPSSYITPKKPVIQNDLFLMKKQIKTTTVTINKYHQTDYNYNHIIVDDDDDDDDNRTLNLMINNKTKIRFSRIDGKVIYLNNDDEIFNDISPILSRSSSSKEYGEENDRHHSSLNILIDDYDFPSTLISSDSINDDDDDDQNDSDIHHNDDEINLLSHDYHRQCVREKKISSTTLSLVNIEKDHHYDDDDYDENYDDNSIGVSSQSFSSLSDYLQNLSTKQKRKKSTSSSSIKEQEMSATNVNDENQ
mgnify:CR=1 FL=1